MASKTRKPFAKIYDMLGRAAHYRNALTRYSHRQVKQRRVEDPGLNNKGTGKAYLLLAAWLCLSATPVIIEQPEILQYAQTNFVHVGPLETAPNGLVYVKVSDQIIYETLHQLNRNDIAAPDYFSEGKVGAHISVITPEESKTRKLFLPQLNQPVVFAITEFAYVDREDKRIYYLKVEAPQLELIRLSNGLPAKIQDHDFHITVGIAALD